LALLAVGLVAWTAAPASAKKPGDARFPGGFLWGQATAGFQSEAGAGANTDRHSDWWVWSHDPQNVAAGRVSGDLPEDGPGAWALYRRDAKLMHSLKANAFRMGIEWSRIFPRSTAGVDASGGITPAVLEQLDAVADQDAVAHYRAVLKEVRKRHMEPFVTLNHFTLPLWIHDPIAARNAFFTAFLDAPLPTGFGPAGWIDPGIAPEFGKYAAYLGWKFGDAVDLWAPINEPLVAAVSGYVNLPGLAGGFPPGALNFRGAITAALDEVRANAAAYDQVKAWDRGDADRDGSPAQVGLVHNMVAFTPWDATKPLDVRGTQNADYLFNRLFLNAAVKGEVDADADGTISPGERHPELAGKADFVGVNYYFRGRVTGLSFSFSGVIPIINFAPTTGYRTPQNPSAPECPTECSEFGGEIYPEGFREVLNEAGGYGLPLYVTENGIADSNDDQRPQYLVRHLAALHQAIDDGVDVRGYFHWTLVDNFEWAAGYYPKFGLYSYDPATLRRTPRPSATLFRQVAHANAIPAGLLERYAP
jgi:beta-glucosidase/6-phospho-beta-glucosidase/beta-galactosidase